MNRSHFLQKMRGTNSSEEAAGTGEAREERGQGHTLILAQMFFLW